MAMQLRSDPVPVGARLTLVRVDAPTQTARTLAALGLRRGCQFTVSHVTAGGGRVVQVGGARIALDRAVLGCLVTRACEQAA